ncbi:MAG: C39 family peptidase [Elusimicrobia bacterium]|nr:C39 family peptidase [Elusimicrobiota bacterium]
MSYTVTHRTPLDIARAGIEGLEPVPLRDGLVRAPRRGRGFLESPEIETPGAFDDIVASWNARLPEDASLRMSVRVRRAGEWSPWFLVGTATASFASPPAQENAFGRVEVDTLKLSRKAGAFQYRVELEAGRKPALLRLAAVTVCDADAPPEPPAFRDGPWIRELAVEPRSQFKEPAELQWDICSPTSLAMVLGFWGARRPTLKVAQRVKDHSTGIFGDWPFNVAAAADFGLEAWVSRLESIEDLQAEIAAGRPVVVSLTFGKGEMPGAPLDETKGHLAVVSGFTPQGDLVVMDPAAPEPASVRRVYGRREFHRAWRVNKRGVAYLLGEPLRRTMTVGAPATDLRAKPKPAKKPGPLDPSRLSQLLYGEAVEPLEAKGDWVQVLAVEQEALSRGLPGQASHGQGYRGWVRASDLLYREPMRADAVVSSLRTTFSAPPCGAELSMGTKVVFLEDRGESSLIRLLDGRTSLLPSRDLAPLGPSAEPEPEVRSRVLKAAGLLMGAAYVWGGRAAVGPFPGVDCSGLTSLAYRVAGMEIPRDAQDQMLKSSRLSPSDLRPGDLVFLTESAGSKDITHVMMFAGSDSLIESRRSAGGVLQTSFMERFGAPRPSLEDGGIVTDLTEKKRPRRRVFFGTFFPR